jgi:hypothetical protein
LQPLKEDLIDFEEEEAVDIAAVVEKRLQILNKSSEGMKDLVPRQVLVSFQATHFRYYLSSPVEDEDLTALTRQ